MTEPKPFSDEELEVIRAVHIPGCSVQVIIEKGECRECRVCRFLATIAEYKKALDSAMRQVSSLNQGNIADQKRIEELEQEHNNILDDVADQMEKTANQHLANLRRIAELTATIDRLQDNRYGEGVKAGIAEANKDLVPLAKENKRLRGEKKERDDLLAEVMKMDLDIRIEKTMKDFYERQRQALGKEDK